MTVPIVILQVGGCVLVVLTLLEFDRIVRILHTQRHSVWESLGRPPGFFWIPAGSSWLGGWRERQRLISDITFSRPRWLSEDKNLSDIQRRYRLFYVAFVAFFGLWVLAGFIFRWWK
ncbi:MAG: hypothetical protein QOF48_232 [Verrucomicrobiota bacterium]|jgi:hypothetical protein